MKRRKFIKYGCGLTASILVSGSVLAGEDKYNVYALDFYELYLTKIASNVDDPNQVIQDCEDDYLRLKHNMDNRYLIEELELYKFGAQNFGHKVAYDDVCMGYKVTDGHGLRITCSDKDWTSSVDLIKKNGIVYPVYEHRGEELGFDEGDVYIIERAI